MITCVLGSFLPVLGMRCFVSFFLLLVLFLNYAHADKPTVYAALEKQFKSSPVRIGFIAFDSQSGKVLYSYRPNELFIPASILKLFSAYVALNKLGAEYRFETKIYRQVTPDGVVLYVKGGGDPLFRTEELDLLARRIRAVGSEQIKALYVDTSLFSSVRPRVGQRAYGAGSSAMVFNFNSILFEVCPTVPGKDARVLVDPFEYPVRLTGRIATVGGSPAKYSIDEAAAGSYQLNGLIGDRRDCGRHYRNVSDTTGYFLSVLHGRLNQMGVRVDKTGVGIVPASAQLIDSIQSKQLSSILEDLNHFSTNLIAEQIVTMLGKKDDGTYSHDAGVVVLEGIARKLGDARATLADASGLSRANQVTPSLIKEVLFRARNDVRINVEFEKSLPVLGRNGTLKARAKNDSDIVARGKTGSLQNVSSLAGYMYPPSGKKIGFVIIQNGAGDRHSMHIRENKVLTLLNRF